MKQNLEIAKSSCFLFWSFSVWTVHLTKRLINGQATTVDITVSLLKIAVHRTVKITMIGVLNLYRHIEVSLEVS